MANPHAPASVPATIPPATIPPYFTSVTAVDFPFNFLHSEIVRYLRERDADSSEKKTEWLNRVKESDFSQSLLNGSHTNEQSQQISNQIFAQGNAETRLESMGYRVGWALVERVAKDIPRLTNELETMKFICKEFWLTAFGKGVDNLRTNHQGIYIIQDNKFVTVAALSDSTQYLEESIIFLAFPSGIVRGALANLGISAIVNAQVEKLPVVKFNVQLNK
ncbi:transport protein particle (TRAPP) component domain-containing protein [Ditylenchus destructor]|nr:transport protein particle (TRAPP) component domain-containing protein [Ditylenchus destructor]